MRNAIYLTHAFIVHVLFVAGRRLVKDVPPTGVSELVPTIVLPNQMAGDAGLLAYLLVVVAVSAVTYRWIERPGRSYFNKLAVASGPAGEGAASQRPASAR